MAPLGEGASAAPSSSAYEGGGGGGDGEGVGGKFRKRPFRKTHATPYDRPPTALRNPSWLSKLVVDPASKLIAASAQRFFAPVFRKRLPPPLPPPPESNQDSSDKHPEAVLKKQAEAGEAAIDDNQNLTHSTDGGFSELEQLLKQKNFTRSEIDRLTELLHSRAVSLPVEDGVIGAEANTAKQVANFGRQQQFLVPLEEKRTEVGGSHGLNSTPDINKRVLEENNASPAEIAKAYMGNQVSKVSPSMLGLHSRATREDAALLSNVQFTSKSTIISSSKNASTHVEVPVNGFTTPRSWGRSAIYNMARSPYSRVHQTAFEKGSAFRNYAYGRPSLPASSLKEPDGEHESNKALKRRSSVLDDGLGSVGPVRRIRQKHNLLAHKPSLPHGIGGISDAVQHPLSLTQKFHSTKEQRHEGTKFIGENDGNHTPMTSHAHVPPKSSEMAARILEHLEKMTPKEKSAESKLIAAREKTPAKLTTEMLRGPALKSLEDMDSSKLLRSNQDGHKLVEDWSHSNSLSASTPAPASRKEDKIEANGPLNFDSQLDMSTPVENSSITASVKGVLTSIEAADSVANSIAQHPQTKQAFMMCAHEDSVELDDDINFNGPASEPLPEGRGDQETSATNQNSTSMEKVLPNKTAALPETRTPPEPTFGKQSDLDIGNAANVGREKADVIFPASLASSSTSQLVTLPPSTLGFENPKQAIEKVPVFQNSLLLSVTELSGPKPLPWTNQKPEISNSSDGTGTGVTDASLGIPVYEKGKDTNSQEVKSNGKLITVDSVAFNTISSGGMSSIVPISSSSGPLSISPSTLSSAQTSASTGFPHQFLGNSTSNPASSFSAISSATTTSISAASAALSNSPVVSTTEPPVMPVFKFGSSIDPSMSVSSAAGAESSVIKTNTEKEANSGSSNNLTFGSTSFGLVGTGSSIFGLSSTITSSTAYSQSQGSLSSTGGGSMSSLQSSVAGSLTASVTQGLPNLFGSSASSPVFGTSGVASFTSSNTLFSSPTTTTKLFGTGNGFGLGASASSAETKSAGSGSGATSSLFSIGVNAPSSSSEANANGVGASTTFSFGASSSATTSVTSSSSSGSTAIFSFGVSSSSLGSNAVSSSSGFFGGSSLSSSTETNPASSASATPSIFGSSWQASKSPPFSSTLNSSPSTAFSFGSGSASFGSNNATSMVFGSPTGASSAGPVFPFTTAPVTNSTSPSLFNAQPFFGNSTPALSASQGNNDQMNTEDSMAEDPVQSSTPVGGFGQQPVSPSPGGFAFGSMVPSQTAPFQFGGQQNQAASQNPSPFQASGSLEFGAGGSFSLGSGDKSGRKIVKVNRNRNRRK